MELSKVFCFAFNSTHSEDIKIPKNDIMVQNSFKYLSNYLHAIKEPFATFAHYIVRVDVEISTNLSDFLYRDGQGLRWD